ncbi:hypothetical protein GOB93_19845 [Acetobacter musti]|uniref:Uncharacterized protein n=1 Tax=Acetobacter musti TaxID=864732 RepID=A0ABX0JVP1_9PROT|nr:hypothetical protein [Acetobacter musti]NHN86833.1 hypothetical protein [Acetobacter musti]
MDAVETSFLAVPLKPSQEAQMLSHASWLKQPHEDDRDAELVRLAVTPAERVLEDHMEQRVLRAINALLAEADVDGPQMSWAIIAGKFLKEKKHYLTKGMTKNRGRPPSGFNAKTAMRASLAKLTALSLEDYDDDLVMTIALTELQCRAYVDSNRCFWAAVVCLMAGDRNFRQPERELA